MKEIHNFTKLCKIERLGFSSGLIPQGIQSSLLAAACFSAPTAQYTYVLDNDDVQYNVQTAPMASDEKIPDSIKHRKLLVIPYSLETKKFVLKTTGTSFRNVISPSQKQIARALSVVWIL